MKFKNLIGLNSSMFSKLLIIIYVFLIVFCYSVDFVHISNFLDSWLGKLQLLLTQSSTRRNLMKEQMKVSTDFHK